jgi:hypothetical protein
MKSVRDVPHLIFFDLVSFITVSPPVGCLVHQVIIEQSSL